MARLSPKHTLEYYERLWFWIEAMRLARQAQGFTSKLCDKIDVLENANDTSAADLDDAAFKLSDGVLTVCEALLKSATRYGSEQVYLDSCYGRVALELLVEDLLNNVSRLDYYGGAIHAELNKARANTDGAVTQEPLSLEDIERRYQYKRWRKDRIRNGLDASRSYFEQLWEGSDDEYRSPLRYTVPWLEAHYASVN